jgi:hypothetical protein
MSDESVQDLLRALAEADASAEAPPEIEIRLRNQFRSRKRQQVWRQAAMWAASAAAVIALFVVFAGRKPAVVPANPVVMSPPAVTVPQVAAPSISQTAVAPSLRPIAVRPRQRQEIVTDFFPLMDPAPPFERGQLLRVELPASAMQMVGLPVHEERLADRVQADVLLGEEGLPRAIRFVKYESK